MNKAPTWRIFSIQRPLPGTWLESVQEFTGQESLRQPSTLPYSSGTVFPKQAWPRQRLSCKENLLCRTCRHWHIWSTVGSSESLYMWTQADTGFVNYVGEKNVLLKPFGLRSSIAGGSENGHGGIGLSNLRIRTGGVMSLDRSHNQFSTAVWTTRSSMRKDNSRVHVWQMLRAVHCTWQIHSDKSTSG